MQKIMTACLSATNTTTPDGIPCEYTWIESSVCDDSFEYDGDVRAYLENTLNEPYRFLSNVTIHNEPEDVIVIGTEDGIPLEIYWAEPAYWYAVQVDNDGSWDGDGSTNFDGDGSFDWDEAYTIADEKAYQNPDSKVEIATIDNPFYNPFCIDCYTVQERKIPDELL